MKLLFVLSYYRGDAHRAEDLLRWIFELGGCGDHPCLIVTEYDARQDQLYRLVKEARRSFQAVEVIQCPNSLEREEWPIGSNWQFETAARYIQEKVGLPFLWCEPDCCPLRPGWFQAIETEYFAVGKPYMGPVLDLPNNGGPPRYLNGTAVYPPNAWKELAPFMHDRSKAWDMASAYWTTPRAHNSTLFYHIWGEEKLPPTFREDVPPGSPRNAVSVRLIPTPAVFFHRCKDGSLISVLRKRMGISSKVFWHCGDHGDIVFSLHFIKSLGGGELLIGPYLNRPGIEGWKITREPMTRARFDWIRPLLERQPYLTKVEFAPLPPANMTHDLNRFRELWFDHGWKNRAEVESLMQAYPARFNHPKLPETDPWLVVPAQQDKCYPIAVNRSDRYRNEEFPWPDIVKRYWGRMKFFGLPHEYREFSQKFGNGAVYRPVKDALDLASQIAGCKLFIGNQSLCDAIALALNIPIIQETSEFTPDCQLRRPNFQSLPSRNRIFCAPLRLPYVAPRYVKSVPDEKGIYQLGPREDAYGIGDTLTITPSILALGPERCVLNLPSSMAKIGELFNGLCRVNLTEDYPVFQHRGIVHQAQQVLNFFGLDFSLCPVIRLEKKEVKEAAHHLKDVNRPIAFVPSVSKQWAHYRERPPEYWAEVLTHLPGNTFLQFGRTDYPLVDGAVRAPFVSLRELAAIYANIGRYLGVDTGDQHIMLAVGGRTATLVPDAHPTWYSYSEWHYHIPTAKYTHYNTPHEVYDFIAN